MISSMSRAKRSTKTAARWLCRWGTASGLLPKGMGMEITGMIRPNSISPCWSQGAGIGMGRGWEWGWRWGYSCPSPLSHTQLQLSQ